jgi:hypothetical protein
VACAHRRPPADPLVHAHRPDPTRGLALHARTRHAARLPRPGQRRANRSVAAAPAGDALAGREPAYPGGLGTDRDRGRLPAADLADRVCRGAGGAAQPGAARHLPATLRRAATPDARSAGRAHRRAGRSGPSLAAARPTAAGCGGGHPGSGAQAAATKHPRGRLGSRPGGGSGGRGRARRVAGLGAGAATRRAARPPRGRHCWPPLAAGRPAGGTGHCARLGASRRRRCRCHSGGGSGAVGDGGHHRAGPQARDRRPRHRSRRARGRGSAGCRTLSGRPSGHPPPRPAAAIASAPRAGGAAGRVRRDERPGPHPADPGHRAHAYLGGAGPGR